MKLYYTRQKLGSNFLVRNFFANMTKSANIFYPRISHGIPQNSRHFYAGELLPTQISKIFMSGKSRVLKYAVWATQR